MMKRLDSFFTAIASWIASATGQPAAFVGAFTIVILWAVAGPVFGYSATWQLLINTGTTIVTFLMVFLIQNSQNRDTASMQAKLDELLYATKGAREQFIGIERLTASEVEKIRDALEKEIDDDRSTAMHDSVSAMVRKL